VSPWNKVWEYTYTSDCSERDDYLHNLMIADYYGVNAGGYLYIGLRHNISPARQFRLVGFRFSESSNGISAEWAKVS